MSCKRLVVNGFNPITLLPSPRCRPKETEGPKAFHPDATISDVKELFDLRHRYQDTPKHFSTNVQRKEFLKDSLRQLDTSRLPAWLKHHRQVLRFNAYFLEAVHDSSVENFRVRSVVVYYYLEDNTMSIEEPKIGNSGLVQGRLVARGKIAKDVSVKDGPSYQPQDFKCGDSLMIGGRTLRLTSCDAFTRAFYEAHGWDVGVEEAMPTDVFTEHINNKNSNAAQCGRSTENKEFAELALGGTRKNVGVEQYLANDRKVLRFYSFSLEKAVVVYHVVNYFLANDTIQINERNFRNSGRDNWSTLFKRATLRKNPVITATPGMWEPEAIVYKPEDLGIGKTVNVYGRILNLYDCDEFTRDFYRKRYGIEMPTQSEEDLRRTLKQMGVVPEFQSDAALHFVGNQKCSHEISSGRYHTVTNNAQIVATDVSEVLRFECIMHEPANIDANRRFILSYYINDQSVSVWEMKPTSSFELRNSGHRGGKFIEKLSLKSEATSGNINANATDPFNSNLPENNVEDPMDQFFTGNIVHINSIPFVVGRADEYTLRYMEKHEKEFPFSNIRLICKKITSASAKLLVERVGRSLLHESEAKELVKTVRIVPQKDAAEEQGLFTVRGVLFRDMAISDSTIIKPKELRERIRERTGVSLNGQEITQIVRECAPLNSDAIRVDLFVKCLEDSHAYRWDELLTAEKLKNFKRANSFGNS